jgi:hypothetical protein
LAKLALLVSLVSLDPRVTKVLSDQRAVQDCKDPEVRLVNPVRLEYPVRSDLPARMEPTERRAALERPELPVHQGSLDLEASLVSTETLDPRDLRV